MIPTPDEIRRAYFRARDKKRCEMHRRQTRLRGALEKEHRGPKPVTVMYPESTIPDRFTMAEYKRRQNEFDADARIFINGKQVDTQLELL